MNRKNKKNIAFYFDMLYYLYIFVIVIMIKMTL